MKKGKVLNIKGKLGTASFKFTFLTNKPQKLWPVQEKDMGKVRMFMPRDKMLENFKPTCVSTDVSFSWGQKFIYFPELSQELVDKGVKILSTGPIIPRLSVRIWLVSEGLVLLQEGKDFIKLVPLETEIYLELAGDTDKQTLNMLRKVRRDPEPESSWKWPRLNPASQNTNPIFWEN